MPYEFKQESDVLSTTMESFWIYTSFQIEDSTNFVSIQDGYLAVYFSQQNEDPAIARPKRDAVISCEIKRDSQRTIRLENLSLLASRMAEFTNERSYLHLYRFNTNQLPDWIKIEWAGAYKNPEHNDDHTPLLDRTLSFDSVTDRHVYWMSIEENFQAVAGITVATPFLEKSIFADIIQANTKEIPTLTVKSEWHGGSWDFPNPAEETRDTALEGFAMIAEGAFAALPLSSGLDSTVREDSWLFGRAAGAPPILKRLSDLIYTYPTEEVDGGLRRYLFNAKNTAATSVIPTTRDNPFEILHIRNMNDDRMSSLIADRK